MKAKKTYNIKYGALDVLVYDLSDIVNDAFNEDFITESLGISKLLQPISEDIALKILNDTSDNDILFTGYYWDFNKQDFIKTDNENIAYGLYIHAVIGNKKEAYVEPRNIKNEDTKIYINVIITDYTKTLLSSILFHELQHVRVMYARKDKNVVDLNKTNIYNKFKYHDLSKNIFGKVYKQLLYLMSDSEQSSFLQEVYYYVLKNKDITNFKLDFEIKLKSRIYEYTSILFYLKNLCCSYMSETKDYFIDLLKLGCVLKYNFGFKNKKLTKQYIKDIYDYDQPIDMSIIHDMFDFIFEKIKEYRMKIYKAIYQAILDRS